MRSASALLAVSLALLPGAVIGQPASSPPAAERAADQALSRQTPASYAEAIELYAQARRAQPDDLDTETASSAFRWVVVNDCAPETARDYCSTIKQESRRGLDLAARG